MVIKKIEIIISSIPCNEELVVEIYYNNEQWAEISDEQKSLIIQI